MIRRASLMLVAGYVVANFLALCIPPVASSETNRPAEIFCLVNSTIDWTSNSTIDSKTISQKQCIEDTNSSVLIRPISIECKARGMNGPTECATSGLLHANLKAAVLWKDNKKTNETLTTQSAWNSNLMRFEWSIKTLMGLPTIWIYLKLTDDFGTSSILYELQRNSYVYASKPNIAVKHIVATSAVLECEMLSIMFPLGDGMSLYYRVKLRSEYDEQWTNIGTFQHTTANPANPVETIKLPNLNPFERYNVSVRASTQEHKDDFYSSPSNATFRTESAEPARSPQPQPGAFHFDPIVSGKLTVYWSEISVRDRRGPRIEYHLLGDGHNYECTAIGSVSGNCTALHRAANDSTAQVRVYSYNPQTNRSADFPGLLTIPAAKKRLPLPVGLTVIGYSASAETNWMRRQVLSWQPAVATEGIVSYTVIWCWFGDDCQSDVNTTLLPANETQFVQHADQKLRFAVAANTATSTSGLQWNTCYHEDGDVPLPQVLVHHPDHANNMVRIDLNRLCSDYFRNISIHWCHADCDNAKSCSTKCSTADVPVDTFTHTVSNLQRGTRYKFMINATMKHSNQTVGFGVPFEEYFKESSQVASPPWGIICVAIVIAVGALSYAGNYLYRKYKEVTSFRIQLPDISDPRPVLDQYTIDTACFSTNTNYKSAKETRNNCKQTVPSISEHVKGPTAVHMGFPTMNSNLSATASATAQPLNVARDVYWQSPMERSTAQAVALLNPSEIVIDVGALSNAGNILYRKYKEVTSFRIQMPDRFNQRPVLEQNTIDTARFSTNTNYKRAKEANFKETRNNGKQTLPSISEHVKGPTALNMGFQTMNSNLSATASATAQPLNVGRDVYWQSPVTIEHSPLNKTAYQTTNNSSSDGNVLRPADQTVFSNVSPAETAANRLTCAPLSVEGLRNSQPSTFNGYEPLPITMSVQPTEMPVNISSGYVIRPMDKSKFNQIFQTTTSPSGCTELSEMSSSKAFQTNASIFKETKVEVQRPMDRLASSETSGYTQLPMDRPELDKPHENESIGLKAELSTETPSNESIHDKMDIIVNLQRTVPTSGYVQYPTETPDMSINMPTAMSVQPTEMPLNISSGYVIRPMDKSQFNQIFQTTTIPYECTELSEMSASKAFQTDASIFNETKVEVQRPMVRLASSEPVLNAIQTEIRPELDKPHENESIGLEAELSTETPSNELIHDKMDIIVNPKRTVPTSGYVQYPTERPDMSINMPTAMTVNRSVTSVQPSTEISTSDVKKEIYVQFPTEIIMPTAALLSPSESPVERGPETPSNESNDDKKGSQRIDPNSGSGYVRFPTERPDMNIIMPTTTTVIPSDSSVEHPAETTSNECIDVNKDISQPQRSVSNSGYVRFPTEKPDMSTVIHTSTTVNPPESPVERPMDTIDNEISFDPQRNVPTSGYVTIPTERPDIKSSVLRPKETTSIEANEVEMSVDRQRIDPNIGYVRFPPRIDPTSGYVTIPTERPDLTTTMAEPTVNPFDSSVNPPDNYVYHPNETPSIESSHVEKKISVDPQRIDPTNGYVRFPTERPDMSIPLNTGISTNSELPVSSNGYVYSSPTRNRC